MPPRRRVSAPANRVYELGPILQQAIFTSPPSKSKSKRIRAYGKKTTVRVPKTKDNTLTQMGFVMDNSPPQMSESEDGDEDGNEGGEGEYEKAVRKRRSKRRRMMGDVPDMTPEFYTQTISQVVRSFNSNYGTDEDGTAENMEEEEIAPEKKKDIYHVPSSSPQMTRAQKPIPRKGRSATPRKKSIQPTALINGGVTEENNHPVKSPARNQMPPPETPHRLSSLEIPSSQSPATPLTLPSTKSIRTPFSEQPVNIPINFGEQQIPKDSSPRKRQDDPPATNSKKSNLLSILSEGTRDADVNAKIDDNEPMATQGSRPVDIPLFWDPNPRRRGKISPVKAPVLEIKDTYDMTTDVSQMTRIPPMLEIRDTFDTTTDVSQMTRIPSSTPRIRSSPVKNVRFNIPFEIDEIVTPTKRALREVAEPVSPCPLRMEREILDSDAESDEEDLAEEHNKLVDQVEIDNLTEENGENEEGEEDFMYPLEEARRDRMDDATTEFDAEYSKEDGSQIEGLEDTKPVVLPHIEMIVDTTEPTDNEDGADEVIFSSNARGASPDLDTESDYGEIGAETQYQVEKLTSSSHISLTPDNNSLEPKPETCTEKTQYLETQRIATQHVNNMAARTGESDVFISMSGSDVTSVLDMTRNHLIRNWRLAPNVCRLWIYELQPVSAVQYMAEISMLKRPGELPEVGLGNESFNIRPKNTTYSAYEILQFYELLNPVPYATLIEKGWLDSTPKRWERVAPAVIDELMSNLKPPLFAVHNGNAEEQLWQSSETETQEVTGQLMSNIQQFTQAATVLMPEDEVEIEDEDEIQSSPSKLLAPRRRALQVEEQERAIPALSQATTVDLSQVQTPRHRRQRSVEMVLESPSRPTMSNTPLQLPIHWTPRSTRRDGCLGSSRGMERSSSVREWEENGEEGQEQQSLMPFSMASSQLQLLTKSQLLSESLLQDSVPEPPEWVGESEDEDDL